MRAIAFAFPAVLFFFAGCSQEKLSSQNPAEAPETGKKEEKAPKLEVGGFETPREAWEQLRKRILDKDWEGIWNCFSSQSQEQIILNMDSLRNFWRNREGNEVDRTYGLTYAELLRKEAKDVAILVLKAESDSETSNPSGWVFLDQKIEGDKAEVKFRDGQDEPTMFFVKLEKGWLLNRKGGSRIGSNEASAHYSLQAICVGQEQFKMSMRVANVDLNANGVGEYGFLDELGGIVKCRTDNHGKRDGDQFSAAPYIPRILGTVNAKGVSQKAGYCFICYLPADQKSATPVGGTVDVSAAEYSYIAYAWPVEIGKTGIRMFVIDTQGQPYSLAESTCSGPDNPPRWDLALNAEGTWKSFIDDGGPGQAGGKLKWIPIR